MTAKPLLKSLLTAQIHLIPHTENIMNALQTKISKFQMKNLNDYLRKGKKIIPNGRIQSLKKQFQMLMRHF